AIFNGVDVNQFKLIFTCIIAIEVWEILQNTHEGIDDDKRSKLQMLTFRFENLKMFDDELLAKFFAKLSDISNECFVLGEMILESKLALL
ncbi:hypothetical protein, partial [Klebsiella pneumoniae]|uniref:hypothetical protein n=1 Tax=Klebsiella pneumoniae TaxID=573 RepID=UPI003F52605D